MLRLFLTVFLLLFPFKLAAAATVECHEAVQATYTGGFLGVYRGIATHPDIRDAKRAAKEQASDLCEAALDSICDRNDCYPYDGDTKAWFCASWGCKVVR